MFLSGLNRGFIGIFLKQAFIQIFNFLGFEHGLICKKKEDLFNTSERGGYLIRIEFY